MIPAHHANLHTALTAHHRPAGDLVQLADDIAAVWPVGRPPAAARVHDDALHELARRGTHPVPVVPDRGGVDVSAPADTTVTVLMDGPALATNEDAETLSEKEI